MRKYILDIPIDWLSRQAVERKIAGFVLTGRPHQVTTVNPEFIVESRTNRDFQQALIRADLSLADGAGIVMAQDVLDRAANRSPYVRFFYFFQSAARFLVRRRESYERITGVELSEMVMKRAALDGWRVFLLGGKPNIARTAASRWRDRYPDLTVVGTSSADPDDQSIVAEITRTKPDILLVAYGAPKQELFIATHRHQLGVPVMIGVGGTFDYVAGAISRAPEWMRSLGLEWLFRLIVQPKRWRRIVNAVIKFPGLIAVG